MFLPSVSNFLTHASSISATKISAPLLIRITGTCVQKTPRFQAHTQIYVPVYDIKVSAHPTNQGTKMYPMVIVEHIRLSRKPSQPETLPLQVTYHNSSYYRGCTYSIRQNLYIWDIV